MENTVSVEQEMEQVEVGKPHVVILGAGASYAAFPNGDKNGRKLPLMNNLVQTLGLQDLISSTGLSFSSDNFEDIYSDLHRKPELTGIRADLEKAVYDYFSGMELPDEPTLYDHLVLSLRDKDVIASFNWDPFLAQAIRRNGSRFRLPTALFLHGNVGVGYCPDKHTKGNNGSRCSRCGKALIPTKLLYPVEEKNYHLDEFISHEWELIAHFLKHAFMLTIFGYGAPTSDVSAMELFTEAWGSVDDRVMEETEIVDIKDEDDLCETWSQFIHSHHYQVKHDFYKSWIANHPRRTGEAYFNQFYDSKFIDNNPLPNTASFNDLWAWYDRLQKHEDAHTQE